MFSRDVVRHAMPRARDVLAAVLLGILAQGASVALLATSAWLITRAAEQPPILYLTMAIVAVRAFALSRATFRYLERLSSHHSAFTALATLRVWVYQRMVPLAPAGFRTRKGTLIRGITTDVDTLQDLPLRVVQPVASAIVVVVAAIIALGTIDSRAAAALALTLLGVALVAIGLQTKVSHRAEREIAPAREFLTTALVESVQRRDILVAFDGDDRADQIVRDADENLRTVERSLARAGNLVGGLFVLAGGLATLLVGLIVWDRVPAGEVSGPVFALMVLTPLALMEVWAVIPQALSSWRGVRSAAERIEQQVPAVAPAEIPVDALTHDHTPPMPPVHRIQLDGFQVRWPGSAEPTSAAVSLTAQRGDRILLRGPSGSGKTSLAFGLVKFLAYSGSYRLDGVEASSLSPERVREHVMVIEQQPHLFDTSIRHNLSFAAPEATDAELLHALERVGLASWVTERGGLDQPVGERGALVSGGQAQRIALARALLADASVLIVDEPTAHVDNATAHAIMADLLSVSATDRGERITIVITHEDVDRNAFTHVIDVMGISQTD